MAPKIDIQHEIADDGDVAATEFVEKKRKVPQLRSLVGWGLNANLEFARSDESFFHEATNQMNDQGMNFLNASRTVGGCAEAYVDQVA
jgi:hypothetical protein